MDFNAYDQLAFYTLAKGDSYFIHQHIVDAQAAQTANEDTKPIKLTFGLIGLYLMLEKGYTGREVQLAHMKLAKSRKDWPRFPLPKDRGALTPADVLTAPPGTARDQKIRDWCASVWSAYSKVHEQVRELATEV